MSPSKHSSTKRLSFEDTRKQTLLYHRFIGPKLPLDNYRLVAGILFERFNDNSIRRLHVPPHDQPYILVEFVHDFSPTQTYGPIPVENEVVTQLKNEGAIFKTEAGLDCWRLSQAGKRLVVEEWFQTDLLTDFLAAGATLNITTGQMIWTQYTL